MLFSERCFPPPPLAQRLSAVAGMDLFAVQVEKKHFGDGGSPVEGAWGGTAWTSLFAELPLRETFFSLDCSNCVATEAAASLCTGWMHYAGFIESSVEIKAFTVPLTGWLVLA